MQHDRPNLLDRLVWRPTLRHRGGVAYLTVRAWRASSKPADLALFKAEKRAKRPALIDAAAAEMVGEVRALLAPAPPWSVTSVAPGHSRDAEAWCVLLAREVAARLDLPCFQAFEPRPVAGSSHPRRNLGLPPLRWRVMPAGPVLLVDDVATSGWHLEEALGMLRTAGVPAVGVAWIGPAVRLATVATRPEAGPSYEPLPTRPAMGFAED